MQAKSKLRPFVEGMIGTALFDKEADGFDFESLLGQEGLLNVVHHPADRRIGAVARYKATSHPKNPTSWRPCRQPCTAATYERM
jgi:hypothetical protein